MPAVRRERCPNAALAGVLAAADWGPADLCAAVNGVMGTGYVSRSTVSEWVHSGRRPRAPLPRVVAHLLNVRTGTPVSPGALWPGAAAVDWCVVATADLPRATDGSPCSDAAAWAVDWLQHADADGGDLRTFLPVVREAYEGVVAALFACRGDRPDPVAAQGTKAPFAAYVAAVAGVADDPAMRGGVLLRAAHGHLLVEAGEVARSGGRGGVADSLTWGRCAAVLAAVAQRQGRLGLAQRYLLTAVAAGADRRTMRRVADSIGC